MDWAEELTEDKILEKYGVRPGEITAKLQHSDWLLYACTELARIEQLQPIIKILKHNRIRLKQGVKSELLPLLQFKGIGRIRARKLFFNNIKTVKDIVNVDTHQLAEIVGKALTITMKKEVGEEVDEETIKKTKTTSGKTKQTNLSGF